MSRLTAQAKAVLEKTMRKDMRNAVIVLARKKPLDDISIAEIAKYLQVSSVTVYNYYPNRGELIRDVFRQTRDAVYKKLRKAATAEQDRSAKLLDFARIIFSDFAANENLFMARFSSVPPDSTAAKHQFDEIIDIFANEITLGIAEKVFRPNIDPESAAMMMCGAIMGVNRHCHFKWADMTLNERIKNFNDLLIKGLTLK